ncbi:MAG: hypothetical protein LBH40_01470 [Alphaproteobacteria bacterium]|jgi:hypothetical protein|nr:hypothetical protein [Alphaproteobacteria bacterium]
MVDFYANEVTLSLQEYKKLTIDNVIKQEDIISSEIIPSKNLYESYKIKLKLKYFPLELLGSCNE